MNVEQLNEQLKELYLTEIKDIIMKVRKAEGNIVVEEKIDGDSATIADIEISTLLNIKLKEMLPEALIIEEETFNADVFEKIDQYKYIWVIDPIDGTKAFRTKGNNEYCVAVALLENGKPILSLVYSPEYELKGENGCLFEAREGVDGAYLNGKRIHCESLNATSNCITHTHKDDNRTEIEERIASLADTNEKIKAFDGHSTLVHYCLVAVSETDNEIFTRRSANIWDVIQSAYIVEKAGGVVFYEDGINVMPVDYKKLILDAEMNKLLIPFNIACSKEMKQRII